MLKLVKNERSHARKPRLPLERTKKNEVFERIAKCGLDPAGFEWVEAVSIAQTGQIVPALRHKSTGSYFIFDGRTTKAQGGSFAHGKVTPAPHKPAGFEFVSIFSPGLRQPIETSVSDSWAGQSKCVYEWLDKVKLEAEAPDLWSGVAVETRLSEAASASQNEKFTPAEQERIAAGLFEIEQFVKKIAVPQAGIESRIEEHFQYLREATARLGKRDWLFTLQGVLIAIIIDAGLDGLGIKELFKFAGQQIANALGSAGDVGAAVMRALMGN